MPQTTVLILCETFQIVLVFRSEKKRRQEHDMRTLEFERNMRACQERQSKVMKLAVECSRRQREVK